MSGVIPQMVGIQKLSELRDNLQSFDRDVRVFAEYILNQEGYKNLLIAYNLINLDLGKRPDDTDIEKEPTGRQTSNRYERYTAYLKRKLGQEDEVVNLHGRTGQFRASIDIKVGYDALYFIDRDTKASILEGIWGQVLGITEDQLFEFTEIIKPEFEKFCLKRFKV